MKFRIAKLQEFKEETLSFYQQKLLKAYLYVISRIMKRVRERLNTGLDSTYHVVNNFYVSRFTESNPNKT
jgi:hypothetical protein